MVQDRRLGSNPLEHLVGGDVKLDRRHDRRALSLEQLRNVLNVAARSKRSFRGLTGMDRAMLYEVACNIGFRVNELSTLCPDAFDLDNEPAIVTLAAIGAKNRKRVDQPWQRDAAEDFAITWTAGRPMSRSGRDLAHKAAEMLRLDLEACLAFPTRSKARTVPCLPTFTPCGIRSSSYSTRAV